MPVLKLTDSLVESLECPPGRIHIEYFDTLMRGLYIDALASGRLSQRVRYRLEDKTRVLTLGDARLLDVAEARSMARTVLRKAMNGLDPRVETLPCEGPTVEHFFTNQYLPYVKSYKRSWNTDETMIRLHLLPALGDLPMGSIIPPDIARVVDSMKTRNYAPGTINRLLILMRYGY